MQGIEEIIRKNKEAFNKSEPSPDHFDTFREKLTHYHNINPESWYDRFNIFLKIAAAIFIFVAITSLYYTNSFNFIRNVISDKIASVDLPTEVQDVIQYYNIITDKSFEKIDQLAVSNDEAQKIKEKAIVELKELEDNRSEMEQEYALNPNNERIVNALILNQRQRAIIMEKIINTLNQIN